ncbi:uncharacterized protein LTR77_011002 [Saxophila tyrrhenica]|uniref:Uncharacterized protein n=1 Tax=Saxophila tyrrhenica TaxID=1690608 RepID=A0AAV9NTZ7_9PEZI|nr:hypothetical protein LTR77_011002 [Saxophila tyrrhenica]
MDPKAEADPGCALGGVATAHRDSDVPVERSAPSEASEHQPVAESRRVSDAIRYRVRSNDTGRIDSARPRRTLGVAHDATRSRSQRRLFDGSSFRGRELAQPFHSPEARSPLSQPGIPPTGVSGDRAALSNLTGAYLLRMAEAGDDDVASLLPPDVVPFMATADFHGTDELVDLAAARICRDIVREGSRLTPRVLQTIQSLTPPLRFRVLDQADSTCFAALRRVIAPYNHQYRDQLRRLLPNSHFLRGLDVHQAPRAYEVVCTARENIAALVADTRDAFDTGARLDKVEVSPDYRTVLTLARVTCVLTVWGLECRPLKRVALHDSVRDATYVPSGLIFTVSCDGVVRGRLAAGSLVLTIACDPAYAISASDTFILTHSMDGDNPGTLQLWKWTLRSQQADRMWSGLGTTARVASNGVRMVCCERGRVWLRSCTLPERHRIDLWNAEDEGRVLGDVIDLAISPDGSTVIAIYLQRATIWSVQSPTRPQSFDAPEASGETFDHVAFCPRQGPLASVRGASVPPGAHTRRYGRAFLTREVEKKFPPKNGVFALLPCAIEKAITVLCAIGGFLYH